MADGESAIGEAADAVEEASDTKALDVVARSGFAVMALLHIIVGVIAIALAFGQPGQAEAAGAIEQLGANPWGPAVLWSCVVACTGLALWQLSEATRDVSTALLDTPFGLPVLVAVGLTTMGVGVYFVVKGLRRGFQDELFRFEGTRRGNLIDALGVTGHVAKGIALNLAGLLFVIAAGKQSPEESTGLDGSLKALRDHPFGPHLLVAIGAGFICYGLFALVRARFGRM